MLTTRSRPRATCRHDNPPQALGFLKRFQVIELERRGSDKISGRLVPVLYTLLAEPPAVRKAKELGVWLMESKREVVTLEEVLGGGRGGA
ncbi:MAG: hypothetical protein GU356_04095 [Pyrobaculum sp.]|nr:hypothetical protein [Pyrobaculum sp.]